MASFPFVFASFALIHLASSLNVDIPLPLYELARGGNAVLPCNFKPQKPDNPSITISWVAHPDNPDDSDIEILTYYYFPAPSPPTLDIMNDFEKRASLEVDIPKGSAVLTLKALTSRDNRTFQCEVKIPGDGQGKTSDTTKVVVLVAPSKPICGIQGKAEYYQNINLTCRSEEGTPPPTYQWKSYDVTNTPRPFPLKATEANGVLSLYNISAETSGYYICTSANKLRTESCNLTLSVMPCKYPEHEEYTDKEPEGVELHQERRLESKADKRDDPERVDRLSDYDDRRSDRYDDRRSDRYDDRRSDRYDDRRNDRYDDRRNDRYDDRRSDYDDRRSDYDDRRSDFDDRRNDRYNEPRDSYDDRRRDRYDDRRDRYDHPDDRYDDRRDRYDHPDDSRPPTVPANKPTRN
ncbi:Cell surface A33 antigen [Bagarius yarrelli]|uniref:Cell surface A33 antigen n=1 Tax=Bagarius yarrelli TaxID=175774 RepID=A0A556TKB3_BAGYA|nr:Cell surface A33 antigen [Bagarius yarrelli]